jgi:hemerythrin
MKETGFPAMECHVDEHNAVMKSLREVDALVSDNRPKIIRSLAQELVRWFPGHADYMDASLAQWMAKRRLGGVPVVLRRSLGQTTKQADPAEPES